MCCRYCYPYGKNNAKLIKITVRYKMQTCDFILNDKFFYGIIEGKICKK